MSKINNTTQTIESVVKQLKKLSERLEKVEQNKEDVTNMENTVNILSSFLGQQYDKQAALMADFFEDFKKYSVEIQAEREGLKEQVKKVGLNIESIKKRVDFIENKRKKFTKFVPIPNDKEEAEETIIETSHEFFSVIHYIISYIISLIREKGGNSEIAEEIKERAEYMTCNVVRCSLFFLERYKEEGELITEAVNRMEIWQAQINKRIRDLEQQILKT